MARMEIWMGRANTGKSLRVLEKIRDLGDSGGGQLLLVPEHATYQAELDLCRVCGDTASRHGEVLSFRLLASRVLARTGGAADGTLDAGGKLLMMQRALQEERQRQEQNLADIFREIGLRDSKGQPITNVEELRSWKQAADLARVQKELKSGTLSADGLSALVREALRQSGQIQTGSAPTAGQKQDGVSERPTAEAGGQTGSPGGQQRNQERQVPQEQVDQELAEIHRLDPSVETLEDIMGMDTRDAFVAAVRRGNSFLDAFRLANFDRLQESRRQETAQRAAQAERNRTRSKEHMTATGTRGEGSVAVPAETLELYRQLMPKATDAEISAHYNKTLHDFK